jgi:molecular chaperone DnaK (HSP70)
LESPGFQPWGGRQDRRDAERRARLDPTRFEPNSKRRIDEQTLLLGTDIVPVNEVLAAILRRVLDETIRQLGGEKPDEVRLTHPAQWGPVRRNVLLSAARLAGMGNAVSLVPEPVAAAAYFASFPGKSLAPGQALAVYDLGAGTFDVAVVGATQSGFGCSLRTALPTSAASMSIRRCWCTSVVRCPIVTRSAGSGCCARNRPRTGAPGAPCRKT